MYDSMILMEYIETGKNHKADMLSRSCTSKENRIRCDKLIQQLCLIECEVDSDCFTVYDKW